MRWLSFCGILVLFCSIYVAADECGLEPQQIGLSYSQISAQRRLKFIMFPPCERMNDVKGFWTEYLQDSPPFITYGEESNITITERMYSSHTLIIPETWSGMVFNFVLNTTRKGIAYSYQIHYVKDNMTMESDVFTFEVWDRDVVRFIATGDMGTTLDASSTVNGMLSRLDDVDLIIHCGDLSYAWASETSSPNGQNTSDAFGRLIEPLASQVPYMVAPGNHEFYEYKFSSYVGRYFMPNQDFPNTQSNVTSELWYSFDVENVHFISLNSESPMSPGSPQRVWLERDLASPRSTLFNVVFLHQPPYSSSANHGSNLQIRSDLTAVSRKYPIDVVIAGHDHIYERTYPVIDGVPTSSNAGTREDPYLDPRAPLYMVVGNGGTRLYPNLIQPQPAWSASRVATYGWSYLEFHRNGTIMGRSVPNDGSSGDLFFILKTGNPITSGSVSTRPSHALLYVILIVPSVICIASIGINFWLGKSIRGKLAGIYEKSQVHGSDGGISMRSPYVKIRSTHGPESEL